MASKHNASSASRVALVALAALSALALASALDPDQAYAVEPFFDMTVPKSSIPVQTIPYALKATVRWSFQATDSTGQFYKAPIPGMEKYFKTKMPATIRPIPGKPTTSGIQVVRSLGDCAKATMRQPLPQSRVVSTLPTGLRFDAAMPAYYADVKAPLAKGCYWVNLWWWGVLTCRALIQVV